MIDGWPDVLKCGSGSSYKGYLFYISEVHDDKVIYSAPNLQEKAQVHFTIDKEYLTRNASTALSVISTVPI